ncbi:MAG: hypothetical protein IJ538_04735 [Clostridia bacterium]|nr:hypothetical protein [Clostridia bacterium]
MENLSKEFIDLKQIVDKDKSAVPKVVFEKMKYDLIDVFSRFSIDLKNEDISINFHILKSGKINVCVDIKTDGFSLISKL